MHGIGPVVLLSLLAVSVSVPVSSPVEVDSSPLLEDVSAKHEASSSNLAPSPHGL
jgi:hypothetical protein